MKRYAYVGGYLVDAPTGDFVRFDDRQEEIEALERDCAAFQDMAHVSALGEKAARAQVAELTAEVGLLQRGYDQAIGVRWTTAVENERAACATPADEKASQCRALGDECCWSAADSIAAAIRARGDK